MDRLRRATFEGRDEAEEAEVDAGGADERREDEAGTPDGGGKARLAEEADKRLASSIERL